MKPTLYPILKGMCLAGLCVFMAGCSPSARSLTSAQQTPFFRPPTPSTEPAFSSTSTTQPEVSADAQNQSAAPCTDSLTFISDVTIPDGTVVAPLSTLDKRWEVENNGACGWNENYRLRLIAGPDMGARNEQALYPARSGTRAILRITFNAPPEENSYRSAWQAYNAQGEPFGDPIFIDIVVSNTPE